jgi:solute carrier family 45, member 1/2/4
MDPEAAMEEGTRLGSRAMFFNAILSLVANIVLPFFVAEAQHTHKDMFAASRWTNLFNKLKVHLGALWAASHLLFAICMGATL